MWARARLRIKWRDLLFGTMSCFTGMERQAVLSKIENYWQDDVPMITTYSVRSGFDLLLRALPMEQGDEILFSAINIKGMINIVKREGFVPVPVDLDMDNMAPRLDCLEKAITSKSKILVIAHLFGARADIGPIIELAHKHNLIVLEDCAQSFCGRAFTGNPEADLVMFSFGPLKTTTALGGALVRIKDPELAKRMAKIQADYPIQTGRNQLKRIVKFSAIKAVVSRGLLAIMHKILKARGTTYDEMLIKPVRNVAKLGKANSLRHQSSTALLRLLWQRIDNFDIPDLKQRAALGALLSERIGQAYTMPALANADHDFWLFPIIAEKPEKLVVALRDQGFDAADLPSARAVSPPEGRAELTPETADYALKNIVILPCYPEMPEAEIVRLAEVVREVRDAAE